MAQLRRNGLTGQTRTVTRFRKSAGIESCHSINFRKGESVKIYRLKKIKDNKFDGEHPNKIYVDYERFGVIQGPPDVGYYFCLKFDNGRIFRTSQVKKVTELEYGYLIDTINSTYELRLVYDTSLRNE